MPFCFAISFMQYASLGNTIQRRLSALQEITEKRMAMAMNVVTMPQTLGTTLGSEKYYSLFGCKSCLLRSVFSTTTAPSPKFREKFGTWPGGGTWMVGRNPCRPIRAVADVSCERGTEMAVQEHADHLLILVHGLNARPTDWKHVEDELCTQLGDNFLIHASAANPYLQTQLGIDLGGKRLADEVRQIVRQTKGLKRISFLAHSLGGLFSRYAIADLYRLNDKSQGEVDISNGSHFQGYSNARSIHCKAKLAGLEPVNFITIATPHLGLRGSGQMPMLLGLPVLEMLAATFTSGRTGQQLFLTDGNSNDPPLLLRMAYNCTDGPFISALQAFESRVTYANLNFDFVVGWRTSSIRRESELFTILYPCINYILFDWMDTEAMIQGLQQASWQKVDLSFHSAIWPFFAHNPVGVHHEWLSADAAGVIAHIIDMFKKNERQKSVKTSIRVRTMTPTYHQ
ncbi:unnamed protein product [Sphagnum troendelagicum]